MENDCLKSGQQRERPDQAIPSLPRPRKACSHGTGSLAGADSVGVAVEPASSAKTIRREKDRTLGSG